jgi:Ca2+/Na+ antiporter
MKVSNETVYVAIVICLIGLIIVVAPLVLKNEQVRKFTIDKFNLALLVIIAGALFFLDIRVGSIFTILLLTFLAYAKLDGFTNEKFNDTNPTEYAKQFSLYTPETVERNYTMEVETFDNCNNEKLPSEQFTDTSVNIPNGTLLEETVSRVANVDEDTEMTSNVGQYMNQLQQDAITNKLKTENYDYDSVSCRYDIAESAQSTTLNGPPLSWNNTYSGETVNGQLFYPLHG